MHWMFIPYKRLFDFKGRSRRQEFWMFQLWVVLLLVVVGVVLSPSGSNRSPTSSGLVVIFMVIIILFGVVLPNIGLTVRRFHDQNITGWAVLLHFIPYVGSLIVFVYMLFDGKAGDNRFGPDPKGREGDTIV